MELLTAKLDTSVDIQHPLEAHPGRRRALGAEARLNQVLREAGLARRGHRNGVRALTDQVLRRGYPCRMTSCTLVMPP